MWSVGRSGVRVIGRDNFCEARFTSLEVHVAVSNVYMDENCSKVLSIKSYSISDRSISILKRPVVYC